MFWNVRGVNKCAKQRDVKVFLNINRCSLVCLLETKVKAQNLGALYLNLFKGWCFTSNNICHPGGRIILAWNPGEFQVNPIFCSSQLVHCDITLKNGSKFWCSFIYGHNSQTKRLALWKDLCDIADTLTGPWILMGDFNCVLHTGERVGSAVRLSEIQDFQNCVSKCSIEDAKSSGNFYTWNNKQQGDNRVFSKLDRVLINQAWSSQYPNTEVSFRNEAYFDHCPGVITVYPQLAVGRKPFRFFSIWQEDPRYRDIVTSAWNGVYQGTKMFQVVQKLKNVKITLKVLNTEGFGEIEVKEYKASQTLNTLQTALHLNPSDGELADREKVALQEYNLAHKAYLSFLAHKAKVDWVKGGDDNTALFHRSIRQRQIHNTIFSIKDMHGNWTSDPAQVLDAFLEYYK
ncbi:uncharacterized protein [Spinacia oleracea]|uniref:Endonuclease/exonuclease/phosphatase domain-containing protein n=1 Tax=Spinacia oleracea TaxID=3562 RepID=A0A9R0J2L1_SPIOL|nr:uncharacterized protein LOC110798023 [Spinacia oleracea]